MLLQDAGICREITRFDLAAHMTCRPSSTTARNNTDIRSSVGHAASAHQDVITSRNLGIDEGQRSNVRIRHVQGPSSRNQMRFPGNHLARRSLRAAKGVANAPVTPAEDRYMDCMTLRHAGCTAAVKPIA